jgi:transcriptional regulator with XRE-family HTH domain
MPHSMQAEDGRANRRSPGRKSKRPTLWTGFGTLLRQLRQDKGLTLAALAQRAGLPESAVSWLSRLENGEIKWVDTDHVRAIAKGLGVEHTMLIAAREPRPSRRSGRRPLRRFPGQADANGFRSVTAIPVELNPMLNGDTPRSLPAVGTLAAHRPVALVDMLPDLRQEGFVERELFILSLSGLNPFAPDTSLGRHWISSLTQAVQAGWRITHLVQPHSETAYSALNTMLAVLHQTQGKGYQVYALPQDATPHPLAGRDYVFVPGYEAVELVPVYSSASDHYSLNRTSSYAPEDERYKDLATYTERICHVSSVLARFYPRTLYDPSFTLAIERTERHPGPRILSLYGVSETLVPADIHARRADSLVVDEAIRENIRQVVASRISRQQGLQDQLQAHRKEEGYVRDLCPRLALEQLVYQGCYSLDDNLTLAGARALTYSERKAVLQNLIHVLEAYYPTYQFGILDEKGPRPMFCLAKQNLATLIELWYTDSHRQYAQIDLEIRDEFIADRFYMQLAHRWDKPGAVEADKKAVIAYLQDLISVVDAKEHFAASQRPPSPLPG